MQPNNTKFQIKISKAETSKLDTVDFSKIVFGNTFTDHMFVCTYSNGSWHSPEIKPYGPITISPAAKVFHYGQAVFEGMKAYKDESGSVFLFRPEENYIRINASSKRMAIPELPREIFFNGLEQLVSLDKDWVQPGVGNSLYIRPFVFANQEGVSASPSDSYSFMILLSPAQGYYNKPVKVVIAEKYSRSADGGVGFAKAAGNYGAQFYPTNLAKADGFDQVIWTDANTHNYLEEAGTMNVFFRINNTLCTAPTNDRILDGVTRKSILALAEREGIETEVRRITVTELIEAANSNSLLEIFGAGTAAVVSPVSEFSYQGKSYKVPEQTNSYAALFKKKLNDIQYNLSDDPFNWRHKIA